MKLHGENQYWRVGQMGTVSGDPRISTLSFVCRQRGEGAPPEKELELCSSCSSLFMDPVTWLQHSWLPALPSVHRPPPLRAAASEAGPVLTVMLGRCAGFPRAARQVCGPETATPHAAEPPNPARGSRNGHSISSTVYKTLLPVFRFNA